MQRNTITAKAAQPGSASDIFVINGTTGNDRAVPELVALMAKQGLRFYKSPTDATREGRHGLIAGDDVVIIKVNSQWDERGGTNTDVVKSVINAIIAHPDGFTGEIIIADNGQAQYGSARRRRQPRLHQEQRRRPDPVDAKGADSFAGHRVSTYLWDAITITQVKSIPTETRTDGYVVDEHVSTRTLARWSPTPSSRRNTDSGEPEIRHLGPGETVLRGRRVKLINVPVLKSHFIYGVTGCVKHYMGVGSDKLTAKLGARMHVSVGTGGMGTMMVGTRFPTLNILDATWVNATPGKARLSLRTWRHQANVLPPRHRPGGAGLLGGEEHPDAPGARGGE